MNIYETDIERRNSYDQESERYDRTRYGCKKGKWYHQVEAASVKYFRELPDNASVIDVAAGTGRFTEDLSHQPWTLYAVDQSRGMLSKLRQRLPDDRVKITVGNARGLPFKSDMFDGVSSFKFLHLFKPMDCSDFLMEMRRILKPNGILMVEVNNGFYGVIWGWIRDILDVYILRKKKTFRTVWWPHQVRNLFSGLKIIKLQGTWFPGSGLIASFSPASARLLEKLGNVFPFYYFTGYLVIVAQKPSEH